MSTSRVASSDFPKTEYEAVTCQEAWGLSIQGTPLRWGMTNDGTQASSVRLSHLNLGYYFVKHTVLDVSYNHQARFFFYF